MRSFFRGRPPSTNPPSPPFHHLLRLLFREYLTKFRKLGFGDFFALGFLLLLLPLLFFFLIFSEGKIRYTFRPLLLHLHLPFSPLFNCDTFHIILMRRVLLFFAFLIMLTSSCSALSCPPPPLPHLFHHSLSPFLLPPLLPSVVSDSLLSSESSR